MRAPGYAARRTGLRRIDLRSLVVRDFPLKAAALAISVLAFVAVAESTQQAVVTFRVPVERPADVPAGYVLRGTLGDVAVTLRGPQPAIAKLAQTDIHPVPDLGQADLGRNDVQNVALRVPLADQNVVAETDPPTVPVRIEQIVTRSVTVQVRFANDPPAGFQPGSATRRSTSRRAPTPSRWMPPAMGSTVCSRTRPQCRCTCRCSRPRAPVRSRCSGR